MVRRGANWQLGEWRREEEGNGRKRTNFTKITQRALYFLREEEEEMGRRKEGVQKIAMMKGVGGEEERLEGGGEGSCGLGVEDEL